MAEQPSTDTAPAAPSALAEWQRLFQAYLALGYSTMGAQEAIAPELWRAATAEVARRTASGEFPQNSTDRR
jgi:hypothetical protein